MVQRFGLGALALILLPLGAAGCTRTGDLGRPVAPPVDMRSFFAAGAEGQEDPLAGLSLTGDERELRARAYHFRAGWTSTPTSYYANLRYRYAHSTAGLWGALATDIAEDAELLPPLTEMAYRVAIEDRENLAHLEGRGGATDEAVAKASARAESNHAVIAELANSVDTRIRIYSHAINMASLDAPSRREREALAALSVLTGRAALLAEILRIYEGGAAPLPRLASGAGASLPPDYGAKRPIRATNVPRNAARDIKVIEPPPIVEIPSAR